MIELLDDIRKPTARTAWAWLGIVWLLCLVPASIYLGAPDSHHTMENIAVLSAQETWLRQYGSAKNALDPDPQAWLMPSRSLRPRVVKPPLVVWLDMIAFGQLRPGQPQATPQVLIYRARVVSVVIAMVMIAGIYWIGWTFGGLRMALLASLVAGTMWFVQRQGRTASYDIHLAAWSAISAAAAAWAVGAAGDSDVSARRRACGWLIAGAATGLGWLSKDALAIVLAIIPWSALIALNPKRRKANIMWFGGALLVALMVALPWHVWAAINVPQALKAWLHETRAKRDSFAPPWYYLGLLALVAPWTVWLIGGLVLPWLAEAKTASRRLRVAWWWFVGIFIFFSIPGAKQQRYILPIIPAASLLIAQVWVWHQQKADRSQPDQGVNLLRIPHWLGLIAASIVIPVVLIFKPQWIGPASWPVAVAGGVGMTLLALLGVYWHWRWQPMRAAYTTVAWALVCTTLSWAAYNTSPIRDHPLRPQAEYADAVVGDEPMGGLWVRQQTQSFNEEFMLYAQRVVYPVRANQLADAPWRYFIADDTEANTHTMRQAGFEPVGRFMQDKDRPNVIWLRTSTTTSE